MTSRRPGSTMLFTLAGLLLAITGATGAAQEGVAQTPAREPTTEELELWRTHLRSQFDDIHDVSMRFHMEDPSIGGLIGLRLTWEDGRLVAGEVVTNETGSDAEGEALLEAIRGWTVDGLEGPVTIQSAFQIRLVGSDDPDFPRRAIVTGSVRDSEGKPVARATIRFEPGEGGAPAVPDARANREGIFVRTLIPPGAWTVVVAADGFATYRSAPLTLEAGSHRIERVILAAAPETGAPQ